MNDVTGSSKDSFFRKKKQTSFRADLIKTGFDEVSAKVNVDDLII